MVDDGFDVETFTFMRDYAANVLSGARQILWEVEHSPSYALLAAADIAAKREIANALLAAPVRLRNLVHNRAEALKDPAYVHRQWLKGQEEGGGW